MLIDFQILKQDLLVHFIISTSTSKVAFKHQISFQLPSSNIGGYIQFGGVQFKVVVAKATRN